MSEEMVHKVAFDMVNNGFHNAIKEVQRLEAENDALKKRCEELQKDAMFRRINLQVEQIEKLQSMLKEASEVMDKLSERIDLWERGVAESVEVHAVNQEAKSFLKLIKGVV